MPESNWMESDVQSLVDGTGGIPLTIGAVTAQCQIRRGSVDVASGEDGSLRGRQVIAMGVWQTWQAVAIHGAAATLEAVAYTVIAGLQDIDDPAQIAITLRKV